jgi:tetratricopeptide (TPR) repeat protein
MTDTVTITGADGSEHLYDLERVLASMLQMLQANRVDEAADIYARIRDDVAYPLIARAQGDKDTFRRLANLFFRARDFARAAYCCENLEEPKKAASLYEQAGDFAAAAQMFATAGDVPRAAEMFERAGSLVEAARMYVNVATPEALMRAAACFQRAGRLFDAAQCFERVGRPEQALALYGSIDDDSADKKVAQKLAKALVERIADRADASSVSSVSPVSPSPASSSFSFSTPSLSADDPDTQPPDTEPDIAPLAHLTPAQPAMTSPSPRGPQPVLLGAVARVDVAARPVTMMEGFDALKALPLFAPLSLPELKAVHHLCTVVTLSTQELLIEAGAPSPALWIVLEGGLVVSASSGAEVAQVGRGGHVGEMGLFDDAPASVDVVVAAAGRALRLDRRGFRDMIAANDALAARVYRVLFTTMRDRLRATTDRIALSS